MNITEHLVHCEAAIAECERCLKDAKAHVLSASARSASIPRSLIEPFIRQCRARLSPSLPDGAAIMRASLDGNDVVVTAGEARALVAAFEGAKVDSRPSLDEVTTPSKLLEACNGVAEIILEYSREPMVHPAAKERCERFIHQLNMANGAVSDTAEPSQLRKLIYASYDEVKGTP